VVAGLRAVDPDRSTARYALALVHRADADSEDLVALLPAALAAAAVPETVDSLLLLYGRALQATAGCGQALLQYRAVLRRSQDSVTRASARQGAADCAYALGERADTAGRHQEAALWFAESARVDSTTPTGRRALLRYGVARLSQGDTLAAALAFQTVVSGDRSDSMGVAAASQLGALGMHSPPADSAGTGER
jgi:tetratricopeptide (TPR) repeat protein